MIEEATLQFLAQSQVQLYLAIALGIGGFFGIVIGYLWARRRSTALEIELAKTSAEIKSQESVAEESDLAIAQAIAQLNASFAELSHHALSQNSDNFLRLAKENLGRHQERARSELDDKSQSIERLVKPIHEALDKTRQQITDIEKQRHQAFGGINEQLKSMATDQSTLQAETRNLVNALRRPEVRGQWGELTLRRIVELAGLVEHCDFIEQAHVTTEDAAIRPDMIVRLPDRGKLIIDVKTPLDAYLSAIEAPNDQERKVAMVRHAKNVANRVRELSSKAYWTQFDRSPQFVILFIPGDQFLAAAISENPSLFDDAIHRNIIITTPASLIGLLKIVAYGWAQLSLDENAEEIRKLGQEMHNRVRAFTEHMFKLGKQLEGGVNTFNKAVGSLEQKVLPGARKFSELGVSAKEGIPVLDAVEATVRLPVEQETDAEDPDTASSSAAISKIKVGKTPPGLAADDDQHPPASA